MTPDNPYQAPASSAAPGSTRVPRRWIAIVLSLAAFQTLVVALYTPTTLSQLRDGGISVLTAMAWASASGLLATGSLVLMVSPRLATCLLFLAAVLSALTYAQWRPPFVFTGLLVAVCAALVSSVSARSARI